MLDEALEYGRTIFNYEISILVDGSIIYTTNSRGFIGITIEANQVDLYPKIQAYLYIPIHIIQKMQSSPETLQTHVYINGITSLQDDDGEDIADEKLYIDHTFQTLLHLEKSTVDIEEKDFDNDTTTDPPTVQIKLDLTHAEHKTLGSKLVNVNLAAATASDAICNILTQCGFGPNTVLCDPPTVSTVHSQIVVPEMRLIDALFYLQKWYGIYNEDLNVYFDLDKLYILMTYGAEHAFSADSYNTLDIIINENAVSDERAIVWGDDPDNKKFVTIQPNSIRVVEGSTNKADSVGTNIRLVDSDKIASALTMDGGTEEYTPVVENVSTEMKKHSMTEKNEVILQNNTNNPAALNSRLNMHRHIGTRSVMVIRNCPPNLCTFNKKFVIGYMDNDKANRDEGSINIPTYIKYAFIGSQNNPQEASLTSSVQMVRTT